MNVISSTCQLEDLTVVFSMILLHFVRSSLPFIPIQLLLLDSTRSSLALCDNSHSLRRAMVIMA
jgi:hypothetical protein